MYQRVNYADIHCYDSLGLVSVRDELFKPVCLSLCSEYLSAACGCGCGDYLWLRSYTDELGRISYGLEASVLSWEGYHTVEISKGLLHSCEWELGRLQRAARRLLARVRLERSLAAIRALRRRLPVELVLLCLPWS